jgi:hypothetical protein
MVFMRPALLAERAIGQHAVHELHAARIQCILGSMKNVTITVEESALEWARIEAAKRNSSVSRLVGEILAEKMRQEDAYAQAMRKAIKFESWGKSDGHFLTRNEMYERTGFR